MRWNGCRRGLALLVSIVSLASLALAGCAPSLPAIERATGTSGLAATATAQATLTPALPGPADVTFKESKEIRGGIWDMIAGADGAAWFTTASAVNRMTVDGKIRAFPTRGYPENLLVGPDKNVWFIERSTDSLPYRIARITASGALHEFPMPSYQRIFTPNLVVGEDGALWGITSSLPLVNGNTYEISASVIRIATNGNMTRYPLPANYAPSMFGDINILARAGGGAWLSAGRDSVTQESDGVLRLTPIGAYLGFITPSGRLTRITLPKASEPDLFLASVDGNGSLWATYGGGPSSALYMISLAGAMTKVASASALSAVPQASVFDSRGTLWYIGGYRGGGHTVLHSVTSAGTVTAVPYGDGQSIDPLPYEAHVADRVIIGPDGNIWLTERISDYIGRMTLGGSLTEFRLPSPAHRISLLDALIVGSDNNLWYVRNYYDSPDRAPVSGVIGQLIL
jgi:streptogramin lyase